MTRNELLLRHLKRAKIDSYDDVNPDTFSKLLKLVEETYIEKETDKDYYENASKVASIEFQQLNQALTAKINELEDINNYTNNSIEYAALMQQAILPNIKILESFCKDNFVCWSPKDIVGGDIYFFNILDNNTLLMMVIDGAGHGVSGGFLTMLVKAIQEQIIAKVKNGLLKPNPAEILSFFNKSLKTMLHQTYGKSQSNSGFDGAILYYNKSTNICKYAGAKMPLYVLNNKELEVIKPDRKSVGYCRVDMMQKYTEHTINIEEGTQLYLTTDGIQDQEGLHNTRFGVKRFKEILITNSSEKLETQYKLLQENFLNFKGELAQSDDITVIGLQFY